VSENEKSKPFVQVILWELLAAYGLFRLIQCGSGQDAWTFRFVYNACFFLVFYPCLAFWRFGGVPGLIKFILFPIGLLLRLGVMVSAYFWTAYIFWSVQHMELVDLMFRRPVVIGFLFFLIYWSFIGTLLGTKGQASSVWGLTRLTLFTVGSGLIGFLIGRGLDLALAARQWPADQRLWILVLSTLLFALVGSWVGKFRERNKTNDN
jgi:hypothetical protein